MSTFHQDFDDYHAWLATQCDIDEEALDKKREKLRADAFSFLRASYFRWCRTIANVCPDMMSAPPVLAVGDIHVENYGTWRDAEHRWVWGVNDFDEAARMPFTLDLVRLGVSALLAPGLSSKPAKVASALLRGYAAGLSEPGPVLLDDGLPWLRAALHRAQDEAQDTDDDPWLKFWAKLDAAHDAEMPPALLEAVRATMPADTQIERCVSLVKGGGSLGRPRLVAIGRWQGGRVLREAKATVPSAWLWAHERVRKTNDSFTLMHSQHRSPEAGAARLAGWQIRRLAPDAHKLDLHEIGDDALGKPLLKAMAADLAAVHAADQRSAAIGQYLQAQASTEGWLEAAIVRAADAVVADFQQQRERQV